MHVLSIGSLLDDGTRSVCNVHTVYTLVGANSQVCVGNVWVGCSLRWLKDRLFPLLKEKVFFPRNDDGMANVYDWPFICISMAI